MSESQTIPSELPSDTIIIESCKPVVVQGEFLGLWLQANIKGRSQSFYLSAKVLPYSLF